MSKGITDILELTDGNRPPKPLACGTSRIAIWAVALGSTSLVLGLLAFGCPSISSTGFLGYRVPVWFYTVIALSILSGLGAVLLAIAGLVRIAWSPGRTHGYRLCIAGALLGLGGYAAWFTAFLRAAN